MFLGVILSCLVATLLFYFYMIYRDKKYESDEAMYIIIIMAALLVTATITRSIEIREAQPKETQVLEKKQQY